MDGILWVKKVSRHQSIFGGIFFILKGPRADRIFLKKIWQ
jgi:hypothetical protein